MAQLNECSCGCGNMGECNSDKFREKETSNYMFFGDLEVIKRSVDTMMKMDPDAVDEILTNGHDWAANHIATSKDDIEEVAGFLMNELGGHSKSANMSGLPFVHTFESYTRRFEMEDSNDDDALAEKLMHAVREEDWDLVKSVSMTLRYRSKY